MNGTGLSLENYIDDPSMNNDEMELFYPNPVWVHFISKLEQFVNEV